MNMPLRPNGRTRAGYLVEGEPSVRSRARSDVAFTIEPPVSPELVSGEADLEQPLADDVRLTLGRVADHLRGLHRELAELQDDDLAAGRRFRDPVVEFAPDLEEPVAAQGDQFVDDAGPDPRAGLESEAESLRALAVAEARADAASIRAEAQREAAELRAAAEEDARDLRAGAEEHARALRDAATRTAAELSSEIEELASRLSEEIASVHADAKRIRGELRQAAESVLADAEHDAEELRRRMIAGARADAEREARAARAELAEEMREAAITAISRVTREHVEDLKQLTATIVREPADGITVEDALAELGLAASVLEQSITRLAVALGPGERSDD